MGSDWSKLLFIQSQVCFFSFTSLHCRTDSQRFCRNEYNLTGICSQKFCPLANSQYATVREIDGSCYLYMKTIERSHLPSKLWERVKLSKNFNKALDQIKKELIYWPSHIQRKCAERLKVLIQYLQRVRKLDAKKHLMPELLPVKKKIEKREASREARAEKVARLETSIEKEILERLKSGTYGEIYNFDRNAFENVLQNDPNAVDEEHEMEEEYESESERMFVEGDYSDEEDVEDLFGEESEGKHSKKYLDDYLVDEEAESIDSKNIPKSNLKAKKSKKFIEIEYEHERENSEIITQ